MQKADSGHFHSLLPSCSAQGHFWSLPAAESPVFSRSEKLERGCRPCKLQDQTPSHTRTFSEGQSLILQFSFLPGVVHFTLFFFSVLFFFKSCFNFIFSSQLFSLSIVFDIILLTLFQYLFFYFSPAGSLLFFPDVFLLHLSFSFYLLLFPYPLYTS